MGLGAGVLSIKCALTKEGYASGGREGETPSDTLADVARGIVFFFNRKDGRVESAIETQKLGVDFSLCLGLSFSLKTISQAQKQHKQQGNWM